jgi:HSP20 family protein
MWLSVCIARASAGTGTAPSSYNRAAGDNGRLTGASEEVGMAHIVARHNQQTLPARRTSEWDPFEYLREFLQFSPFQDLPRRWLNTDMGLGFAPRFDVREDTDCFVIKADMPGLKQADIEISLTNNRLSISGHREEERTEESNSYAMRERSFGSFTRNFTLPESIDADRIEARMQDGVLEVKVPKRAESKPKKIPLQAGNGNDGGKGHDNGNGHGEGEQKQAPREEGT